MSEIKYIKNPIQFLRDSGLLFEINRTLLHPLGIAMSVQLPLEGEENTKDGVISLWDSTDDPEGIVYGHETFLSGAERYMNYMDEVGDPKLAERFDELGYYIQSIPDPHYIKHGIELEVHPENEASFTFKVPAKWLEIQAWDYYGMELDVLVQSKDALDFGALYLKAKKEDVLL